jgi:hypothetical protein
VVVDQDQRRRATVAHSHQRWFLRRVARRPLEPQLDRLSIVLHPLHALRMPLRSAIAGHDLPAFVAPWLVSGRHAEHSLA